ncbi:MFS transporter [Tsukamurella pulmonis]|uniref:MFS transporter n=1 Tax=Tsukamurella pulmonis TaxID=47312 RepID=UPI001EDD2BA7|nr:MFS transporter [Tsukamurella pulmonis]BDD81686.1 MFS transporter [Tsukamurella pulmonis]
MARDLTPATAASVAGTAPPRRGLALTLLSAAAFLAALDLFIVNVAFHDIEQSFPDSSLDDLSWVLNAYTIIYAALLVPLGRWADQRSRKFGFIVGLAIFTLASAACAVAPSLGFLIAARVVQAVGAAALTPTSLGLIVQIFDGEDRAKAVRIWAAAGGIAAAAGPVVGGFLVASSWRWVFLINIPVGAIVLVLAVLAIPDGKDPNDARTPHPVGAVWLTIAIGALAYALVRGNTWGWTSTTTITVFAVAAAGAALTAQHVTRSTRPLFEPGMLAVPSFRWNTLAVIGFGSAFAGALLTGVLWAQTVWDYTPIQTGLAVAPGPLMVPLFAGIASRLATRISAAVTVIVGCLAFALGCVLLIVSLSVDGAYAAELLPGLAIIGAGTGLALPELLAGATADLPPERSTTGSAIVNTARQIGAVIGVSLVIAALTGLETTSDPTINFRHAWWTCVVAAGVGAIIAAFGMPRRRR